jgi:hypothetical protein
LIARRRIQRTSNRLYRPIARSRNLKQLLQNMFLNDVAPGGSYGRIRSWIEKLIFTLGRSAYRISIGTTIVRVHAEIL